MQYKPIVPVLIVVGALYIVVSSLQHDDQPERFTIRAEGRVHDSPTALTNPPMGQPATLSIEASPKLQVATSNPPIQVPPPRKGPAPFPLYPPDLLPTIFPPTVAAATSPDAPAYLSSTSVVNISRDVHKQGRIDNLCVHPSALHVWRTARGGSIDASSEYGHCTINVNTFNEPPPLTSSGPSELATWHAPAVIVPAMLSTFGSHLWHQLVSIIPTLAHMRAAGIDPTDPSLRIYLGMCRLTSAWKTPAPIFWRMYRILADNETTSVYRHDRYPRDTFNRGVGLPPAWCHSSALVGYPHMCSHRHPLPTLCAANSISASDYRAAVARAVTVFNLDTEPLLPVSRSALSWIYADAAQHGPPHVVGGMGTGAATPLAMTTRHPPATAATAADPPAGAQPAASSLPTADRAPTPAARLDPPYLADRHAVRWTEWPAPRGFAAQHPTAPPHGLVAVVVERKKVLHGTPRHLRGVPELRRILTRRGFAVRDFNTDAPLEAQMAQARAADVLVGVHGAALTWAFVMRPGTAVVEFSPFSNFLLRSGRNTNPSASFGILCGLGGVDHYLDATDSETPSEPFENATVATAFHRQRGKQRFAGGFGVNTTVFVQMLDDIIARRVHIAETGRLPAGLLEGNTTDPLPGVIGWDGKTTM